MGDFATQHEAMLHSLPRWKRGNPLTKCIREHGFMSYMQ